VNLSPPIYGACDFSAKIDLLAQFLALNLEVSANIEKGSSVTAPRPGNYPDAKKPGTQDCIRPMGVI
jgi:hypothetical protein